MNTSLASLPRLAARSVGRNAALLIAVAGLASVASSQVTLLSDAFDGDAHNQSTWTFGSSGGLGTIVVGSGNVVLDANQQANGARAALATDAHNFNPFASELTINLNGLALAGTPGTSFNSLYAVIGRLSTDTTVGATNAGTAASYSAGGAYGTGAAFGVSLLGFTSSYRLQILDSGSSLAVKQTQVNLSGAPTDIIWTIDSDSWSVEVVGATFTTIQVAGLGTTIDSSTSISGTFSNFNLAGLTVGDDVISRFVLGANNGTGVTDGAIATFGDVSVTAAIPEPSSYALLASAFIGAIVMIRRNGRNRR